MNKSGILSLRLAAKTHGSIKTPANGWLRSFPSPNGAAKIHKGVHISQTASPEREHVSRFAFEDCLSELDSLPTRPA
jgi:hypothetical protein